MVLELEHFVYSLYPNRGYGVTAATPNLDKGRWRASSTPFPIDYAELQKLGKVYSLQVIEDHVIFSFFSAEAKDEYNRSGIFSHHLIIPASVYVTYHAPFLPLLPHFITDTRTEGDLAPLKINTEDLRIPFESDILNQNKPSILERIIGCILGGSTAAVVCPDMSTIEMMHLMSAIIRLLPDDIKPVSFITAPLGRAFRQDREESTYKIKMVQNRSIAVTGIGEYIDLTEEIKLPLSQTVQDKAAHYLVKSFLEGGFEALEQLFMAWNEESGKSKDRVAQMKYFVQDIEVKNGQISFDNIAAMWKKGQKQEAKNYARTIIDKGTWRNLNEIVQLCIFLLEKNPAETVSNDIAFITRKTGGLSVEEKTRLFETLIKVFPKLRDIIPSTASLQRVPETATIQNVSGAPPVSSLVAGIKNYDDFKSLSQTILAGSKNDKNAFATNLAYLLTRMREKYREQLLDFILFLISEYPDMKSAIVRELVKEDIIPGDLITRLPRELRQPALTRSAQIIELIKALS
jgi:hypothetical protein